MDKNKMLSLVESGLTIREISTILNKSSSTIRYWLKVFNVKTKRSDKSYKEVKDGLKICISCGEYKSITDFYKSHKDSEVRHIHCKFCQTSYHRNRLKDVKLKIIDYKGNECEDCSLSIKDSHYSVFDLHHIDPSNKDPNFGSIKSWKWVRIKKEVDKCRLLCSNCHRIEHSRIGGWI